MPPASTQVISMYVARAKARNKHQIKAVSITGSMSILSNYGNKMPLNW